MQESRVHFSAWLPSLMCCSDVLNGRSGISPEMAIRLDKAFGGGNRKLKTSEPRPVWSRPGSA
jgi:hypothetical protein